MKHTLPLAARPPAAWSALPHCSEHSHGAVLTKGCQDSAIASPCLLNLLVSIRKAVLHQEENSMETGATE